MSVAGQLEFERRKREQTQLAGQITTDLAPYVNKNNKIIHLIIQYTEEPWTYFICGQPIQQANFDIGGSKIDHQYGNWLDVWSDLQVKQKQKRRRQIWSNYINPHPIQKHQNPKVMLKKNY